MRFLLHPAVGNPIDRAPATPYAANSARVASRMRSFDASALPIGQMLLVTP